MLHVVQVRGVSVTARFDASKVQKASSGKGRSGGQPKASLAKTPPSKAPAALQTDSSTAIVPWSPTGVSPVSQRVDTEDATQSHRAGQAATEGGTAVADELQAIFNPTDTGLETREATPVEQTDTRALARQ